MIEGNKNIKIASATLQERLASVQQRIIKAAHVYGRDIAEIKLVAISKFHPSSAIKELFNAGQLIFGENYLQEAQEKQKELECYQAIKWHFTGHIQSRKAPELIGLFGLIHTLDSISTAQKLENAWQKKLDNGIMLPPQEVLIQVNTGLEPQKSGVMPKDLPALADAVQKLGTIRIRGLMCLPPFTDNPQDAVPHFALLRELKERLSLQLGSDNINELSMGMSQDLELAIAEGATLLRVGTDLFGARPTK